MPPRWNENRLKAKLGIDYPVIQGPLGGLSSQKLTAAVSNFGGLGSFGAHGLSPTAIALSKYPLHNDLTWRDCHGTVGE